MSWRFDKRYTDAMTGLPSYLIRLLKQEKYTPQPYMPRQKDINPKMRAILIDWLIEVHYKFKLHSQTLWLCVNIVDRYLERVAMKRAKLQLVGVTSLLIACKYEEIMPPEVKDCVYLTDYAYEREEVVEMESEILNKLNYQIVVPTGYHFLERYLNCCQASERTRLLASYYSDRNLQETDMLNTRPHVFAAAAIYAALKQQSCQYSSGAHKAGAKTSSVWTVALQEETGLQERDILACARTMVRHVSEEPHTASKRSLLACKKKYTGAKYNNVAALPLPSF